MTNESRIREIMDQMFVVENGQNVTEHTKEMKIKELSQLLTPSQDGKELLQQFKLLIDSSWNGNKGAYVLETYKVEELRATLEKASISLTPSQVDVEDKINVICDVVNDSLEVYDEGIGWDEDKVRELLKEYLTETDSREVK